MVSYSRFGCEQWLVSYHTATTMVFIVICIFFSQTMKFHIKKFKIRPPSGEGKFLDTIALQWRSVQIQRIIKTTFFSLEKVNQKLSMRIFLLQFYLLECRLYYVKMCMQKRLFVMLPSVVSLAMTVEERSTPFFSSNN